MRVVVAMSGGVDSSAVAGLLKEQGHEVIGLAMKTHSLQPKANRACCTPDDMRDARLVADMLDIPFYVLPYEETFNNPYEGVYFFYASIDVDWNGTGEYEYYGYITNFPQSWEEGYEYSEEDGIKLEEEV